MTSLNMFCKVNMSSVASTSFEMCAYNCDSWKEFSSSLDKEDITVDDNACIVSHTLYDTFVQYQPRSDTMKGKC
jgi:hypothetical protein